MLVFCSPEPAKLTDDLQLSYHTRPLCGLPSVLQPHPRVLVAAKLTKGIFITPHAQRERGKVIGRGVHSYIYYIYNIYIIGERAKRARHSQVCSIENRGYIYILLYIVRAIFVLITRKEGGA